MASEQFQFTTLYLIKGGDKMKLSWIVLASLFIGCGNAYAVSMGVGSSVFATQADVEGGTEDTKSVNSLRAYQAITYHSFLKSNIDISPADGYPDKANGFLGTTLSPSDTVTWNMPADKNFKIDMSGTGKMIISSGTNTTNLNHARTLEYVWSGTSSASTDVYGNAEVSLFWGTLTASSNVNTIWEVEVSIDQTANTLYTPAYRIYLDDGVSANLLNSVMAGNLGSVYLSGWVQNYGSTAQQIFKPINYTTSGGSTSLAARIVNAFDSNEDCSLEITSQSGTTTAGYFSAIRHVRIWKTQP